MVAEHLTLGYGTWELSNRETCVENITTAIDVGYRHIDTAQGYDNESDVGAAIEAAEVPRKELFVASKVHSGNLDYDTVIESTKQSREDLGVDTIDLMYVHWPWETYDPQETLPAFDELVDQGIINHVGVSNFRVDQLEEATEILEAPIFAHQVECHPLLPQEELREFAADAGHSLVAYSPLVHGEIFDIPEVIEVAEKHGVSPAQVSLAWLIEKDACPVPKARGEHIMDNYGAIELASRLSEDDIKQIDGIGTRSRFIDPEGAPWNVS